MWAVFALENIQVGRRLPRPPNLTRVCRLLSFEASLFTMEPTGELPTTDMTFAAFPKLVPELRRHVWLAALDLYTLQAYKFYPDIKIDYSQPQPPNDIPVFED